MTVVSRPSAEVHAHDLLAVGLPLRSQARRDRAPRLPLRAEVERGFRRRADGSHPGSHPRLAMAPMSISSAGLEPGERGTLELPASASGAAFMNLACLRSRELALPAYEPGVPKVSGLASGGRRVEWQGKAFVLPLRLRLAGSGR